MIRRNQPDASAGCGTNSAGVAWRRDAAATGLRPAAAVARAKSLYTSPGDTACFSKTFTLILVDLNVVLDVVQRRQPHYATSAGLLSEIVARRIDTCLPAHVVTTLC